MGKTSERLESYQTQMSIYAEQYKMILASDVLDMIEQLQDDLKDDVEKVVTELQKSKSEIALNEDDLNIYCGALNDAIDIVRKGGVI